MIRASAWTNLEFMGSAAENPMGVELFGLVMGLGFVLSFGYWCTDFLVVQRAMAAESMSAARRTPLIAAVPEDVLAVHRDRARHDRAWRSRKWRVRLRAADEDRTARSITTRC